MPFRTLYFAHLSLHILLYICQLVDVRLSIRVCTCYFFHTAYRCLLANTILWLLIYGCNFSKEVCLNFNLPPVPTLTSFISGLKNQIVNVEKKRFSRRGRSGLWKYSKYSASVGNYRNRVEDESHTPVGTLCV